tara:strand:+ start:75 stop:422 length:348 start_codon:yes stop_codon:yes gene_type:complete
MATINSQQITEAGLVPTRTIVTSSDDFVNTGKEFILYTNSSGVTKTVTITAQVTSVNSPIFGTLTKANATKAVSNGETVLIGPFEPSAFNDSDQKCTFAITPFVESTDSVAILYL